MVMKYTIHIFVIIYQKIYIIYTIYIAKAIIYKAKAMYIANFIAIAITMIMNINRYIDIDTPTDTHIYI